MNIISTKVHGILDYLIGVLLIAAPWLFNFANGGAAQHIPVIIGSAMILTAMITDYEFAAVGILSMKTHLLLDVLAGTLLAASPWLFGFSDLIFWPHIILGIIEAATAMITQRKPQVVHQPAPNH